MTAWLRRQAGHPAGCGATMALALAVVAFTLWLGYEMFAAHGWVYWAAGVGLLLGGGVVVGLLGVWAVALFQRLPLLYRWVLLGGVPLLALPFLGLAEWGVAGLLLVLVVPVSLLGVLAGAAWARGNWPAGFAKRAAWLLAAAGVAVVLTLPLLWLFHQGTPTPSPPHPVTPSPPHLVTSPPPHHPGPHTVLTLTYGSGTDLHRPEFATAAQLHTEPVDGRRLLSGWSDLRTQFWGFGEEALPLNGRVWYPAGDGPFPLILIVHGNHTMADFSDAGYAYLGHLFASRGFIAVSVDQNFLNGSAVGDVMQQERLREENDARAWLLLEHLRQWREWNETAGNPFTGRVDLNRVGLIGHSRGGEAVAVAALFNQLPRYPDNAMLRFNYGFGIRAVAALAPVDGQYRPGDRPVTLDGVSYLALQGAHDADVTSFAGLDMFGRVAFSDPETFAATVHIYGANHAYFNTSWGEFDRRPPRGVLNNRADVMPAGEQQQVAQVYLSAFMETALHGEDYRPFFRDHRQGAAWLPQTVYLTQYRDANFVPLADFEEDADPTTGTRPGTVLTGRALTRWQERQLAARAGSREDHVLYLAWEYEVGEAIPEFEVVLQETLAVTETGGLVLVLADVRQAAAGNEPLDFSVVVEDGDGRVAVVPLSAVSAVQPSLPAPLFKTPFPSNLAPWQPIPASFELPWSLFRATNPALDLTAFRAVRLVFDVVPAGELAVVWVGVTGEGTQRFTEEGRGTERG